jgi:hypothetical protein
VGGKEEAKLGQVHCARREAHYYCAPDIGGETGLAEVSQKERGSSSALFTT